MTHAYGDDLAYIHDVGFGDFARNAAPGLLAMLQRHGVDQGLVVDLGCGSGIWARARVPTGQFCQESFLTAQLPACAAVTALGECFNYLFDSRNTRQGLLQLFRRIYQALLPGGLLIFDVAKPGRVPGTGPQRSYREGEDWAVLVTAEENRRRRV